MADYRTLIRRSLTPAESRPRSLSTWILLNLVVLVAYSIAGLVVVLFGIGPAKISPIYPPSGIAVAATLILGPRILPAVFLGQFFNGFPLFQDPHTTITNYILTNTGTGIGSICEALIALATLRYFARAWHPFDRSRDVVIFLLGSSLAAAFVCGAIGTFSLWVNGFVPDHEVRITFITFFLADAAGIAVFGALVLAWYRQPWPDAKIATTCITVVVLILAVAAFEIWSHYPVDYFFLPLLLWAGFRAGSRGVTVAAAAITIVVVLATTRGLGSFVGKTDNESILLLEGFMAVITFTGLLTVAVRAQQRQAETSLARHNRLLERRVADRTAQIAHKNEELQIRQTRIDEDLKTAKILQASILPTDFSSYAATGIAASMKPALEVGGDFYDVFPVHDGQLGLVVADVSGKGVAAAFFMAVTRTMLRGLALTSRTPSECIEHVNDSLCRENPMEMFVTAVYAELHESSGLVTLVNAGHCEPVIARADGSVELLKRSGNPPLGVMAQRVFAERSFTLGEGEMLFLYTDGITEAFDTKGNMFRMQRLLDITQNSKARSPHELMLAVIGEVETFSAGTLQYDDITCLVIRRNAVAAA